MRELTDTDRHILSLGLIALLEEHSGEENTFEFYARVRHAAEGLDIYRDLLADMVRNGMRQVTLRR